MQCVGAWKLSSEHSLMQEKPASEKNLLAVKSEPRLLKSENMA